MVLHVYILFKSDKRSCLFTGRQNNSLLSLISTQHVFFILYRASEAVLRHIHSVGMRLTPSSLPVDSFVYNLLYEVPLPSPSRSTRLFAGKQNIICYRPGTRFFCFYTINYDSKNGTEFERVHFNSY